MLYNLLIKYPNYLVFLVIYLISNITNNKITNNINTLVKSPILYENLIS